MQARLPRQPGKKNVPTTFQSDRDYAPDEVEFMFAVHAFKQASGNQFPSLTEILKVLLSLGYKKQTTV